MSDVSSLDVSHTQVTNFDASTPHAMTATRPGNAPSSGNVCSFTIFDIARVAANRLGDDWSAESGCWSVTGRISAPDADEFTVGVDESGRLYVRLESSCAPTQFPANATAAEGLDITAARVANTIIDLW
ncbi:hypothetical protein U9R90_26965 [Streptomyces sp. E11-3]|uniref:hypothetical protein n=1 Tax=Streptomyces sp. E11-3 TaxID=3110112 RepID=UPI00398081A3